jgi:carboxylesterase type B
MRRLLLAAASLAATTTVMAGIRSEVAIDSGTGFGTTGASPEIRVFKRIPFAAPAVGATRWRPPQAVVNVTSEAATVPAAATLAFFALAYQQLLKGGAHQ